MAAYSNALCESVRHIDMLLLRHRRQGGHDIVGGGGRYPNAEATAANGSNDFARVVAAEDVPASTVSTVHHVRVDSDARNFQPSWPQNRILV